MVQSCSGKIIIFHSKGNTDLVDKTKEDCHDCGFVYIVLFPRVALGFLVWFGFHLFLSSSTNELPQPFVQLVHVVSSVYLYFVPCFLSVVVRSLFCPSVMGFCLFVSLVCWDFQDFVCVLDYNLPVHITLCYVTLCCDIQYCIMLASVTLARITLPYNMLRYLTLNHITSYHNALHHVMLHHVMLHYFAVHCIMLPSVALLYYSTLCYATLYNTKLSFTILQSAT